MLAVIGTGLLAVARAIKEVCRRALVRRGKRVKRVLIVGDRQTKHRLAHFFQTEPAYKLRDDPRVTRIGRWLRRTSLDELPQLIMCSRGTCRWSSPRPKDMQGVAYYNRRHRRRL